jgi:uncharacterized protein (TIGR03067 family)
MFAATCSLLSLIALLSVQDAAVDKDSAGDLKKMQGLWVAESAIGPDGTPAPKEFLDTFKLIVKDDTITMEGPRPAVPEGAEIPEFPRFECKLDASKKPKSIDFKGLTKETKGQTMEGVYEFDGENLKLCFPNNPGDPRPKEVKASPEAKTAVLTLKRPKK